MFFKYVNYLELLNGGQHVVFYCHVIYKMGFCFGVCVVEVHPKATKSKISHKVREKYVPTTLLCLQGIDTLIYLVFTICRAQTRTLSSYEIPTTNFDVHLTSRSRSSSPRVYPAAERSLDQSSRQINRLERER